MGFFIYGTAMQSRQIIPKDNFELIALNIKTIHYILAEKHAKLFKNQKHIFIMCGAIDGVNYLTQNEITIKQLEGSYLRAKSGICSLGSVKISHEEGVKTFFIGAENLLLNFILQLECLLFYVDTPQMATDRIVNAVINKKSDIAEFLNSIDEAAIENNITQWQPLVDKFIFDKKFEGIRKEIEIIVKE